MVKFITFLILLLAVDVHSEIYSLDNKGVKSHFSDLSAAITTSQYKTSIVITSDQTLDRLIIPENISIELKNNSIINVSSELIVNGNIIADRYRIFIGKGSVKGLKSVKPEWFGAVPNSNTDCYDAFNDSISSLSNNGGKVDLGTGTYLLNSKNLHINKNNILIIGEGADKTTIKRSSLLNGFMIQWATKSDTFGGGLQNCTLLGMNSVPNGNGGIGFGYDVKGVYFANKWVLKNVTIDSWSQYGVGINSGNDWSVENVRVINHGHASNGKPIRGAMGFYVYPKHASSNASINNLHSEISLTSMNYGTNSAAIKLQTIKNLMANNITAIRGTEEVMVIDSTDKSSFKNLTIEGSGHPGLAIRSRNPHHKFFGSFNIDGVKFIGNFSRAFVIGAGRITDSAHVLENCHIRNLTGGPKAPVGRNNYTTFKNCTFENFYFESYVNFSEHAVHPHLKDTGNTFKNIVSIGNPISIRASNSEVKDCMSINSKGNGFVLVGDNNVVKNLTINNPAVKAIIIKSGNLNRFNNTRIKGGHGTADIGTNNLIN